MGRYRARHRATAGAPLSLLPAVLSGALLLAAWATPPSPPSDADVKPNGGPSAGSATAAPPAGGTPGVPPAGRAPGVAPAERAPGSAARPGPREQRVTFPARGPGRWITVDRTGTVAGSGGRLLRYHVAVERGIGNLDPVSFAEQVSDTLADPRGWTGGGGLRLQLVGRAVRPDFTVYLATPATRDVLCGSGYDRYTSCRNGDRVVINVARWADGAPGFGDDLAAYRRYVVNHEVGHRLGHGHQRCPGRRRPAPVMQQQTLGLHGCRPNGWPRIDGRAYAGPAGEYDDAAPPGGR